MRTLFVSLLLAAGAVALADEIPADPPAIDLDVAALGSSASARRQLYEAIDTKSLAQVSSDANALVFMPPSRLLDDKARVEKEAARLLEAGRFEEAIWELERVGSTAPLLAVAKSLHASVHPRGCGGAKGKAGDVLTVRGPRKFVATVEGVSAYDESGAVVWAFKRERFSDDATGPWARYSSGQPLELVVGIDAVELRRGEQYPTERLDPATGRLIEVRLGSLGADVPCEPVRGRGFG